MKQTITITKSVGKKAINRSPDVTIIQTRLNQWITGGKLPGVATLGTDGQCGAKTKQAIGAFQVRYLGTAKPDCRVDPGGQTATILGMDYSQSNKPVGDPVVYNGWVSTPTDNSDNVPYWEKRGMCWFGAGAKGGGGAGVGLDVASAVMFNTKDKANWFAIAAGTERKLNIGAGASGGLVVCFATGMYHPNEFNRIELAEWDWAFSVGAKWLSFAGWVAKAPKIHKLVSAMTIAKYSNGDTITELAYILKNGMALFGVKEDDPRPGFITIDLPMAGGGTEAAIYYGITRFQILSCTLV